MGVVLVSEPPFLFWGPCLVAHPPRGCALSMLHAPCPHWSTSSAGTSGSSACIGLSPAVHNSPYAFCQACDLLGHRALLCGLTTHCAAAPGTIIAVGAAIATALAFLAVGAIPKSEPALVVAMWFHVSALLTAAVALTVGSACERRLPQSGPACALCLLTLFYDVQEIAALALCSTRTLEC